MNNAMLQTHNLSVGYDKKVLIQGIEIAVCPGEILTLIGPNGAGKSTIIKSITKQLEILGGTVCVAGKPLSQTGSRELAQKVSVMMTGRLEPELMSCEEVVEAGRFPYTGRFGVLSDADREKVREAMELVHIRDLADKSFTCISDGQRQRVMLARAICQEPEILILDEPTSFLDIRHKLELLAILKALAPERVEELAVNRVKRLAQRHTKQFLEGSSILGINRIERQFVPELIPDEPPGIRRSHRASSNLFLQETDNLIAEIRSIDTAKGISGGSHGFIRIL